MFGKAFITFAVSRRPAGCVSWTDVLEAGTGKEYIRHWMFLAIQHRNCGMYCLVILMVSFVPKP